MIKDKILALRIQGKSYNEISKELNCCKATVCYHCGDKQKEKSLKKTKEYKANNPLIQKIDSFNQAYKKRGLDNKISGFQRKGRKSDLSIKLILEIFGQNPNCYLTGEKIDLSESSTYSFDHKIPVSKGGNNSIENLGICTQDINMAKSDKTPEEFIKLCIKVLEYNGYNLSKIK